MRMKASHEAWDEEVDMLVVGAGAGGMASALVGAQEGLKVLVCEKTSQLGGTASTSAGTIWIPGNRQSQAAGYADTKEAGGIYLDALIQDDRQADVRKAYLETGPDAVDYYIKNTDVLFDVCGTHPDYDCNIPGAAVKGRALYPREFDGRLLGKDFWRIRPPIREFMILGGMMVGKNDIPRLLGRYQSIENFLYSAKLFIRYFFDRLTQKRGTRLVMGNALIGRLFYSLRVRKVRILFDSPLLELIWEDEGVIGAVIKNDGAPLHVKARKGVILATGGYARNKNMRAKFMPSPTPQYSLAAEGNSGDGIALACNIGAEVTERAQGTGAFWTPASVIKYTDGSTGLFPHLSLDRAKPGLIAVNFAGKRFVDEGSSYHDFVESMYESNKNTLTIPAFLICDKNFIAKYGLGAIHPGARNLATYLKMQYIISARSLESLAKLAGIDPSGLVETVRRSNEFARSGIDLDFHKGESELSRFNGDEHHKPNPCLGTINGPDYYALPVWPCEIACSTGLSTDADSRVIDRKGVAISGLYACGNDMASIMRGTYPGPGTTLGPALVFGYRAAMHMARKLH